jgi:hypothetical protein
MKEMTHPNSIHEKHIEILLKVKKQGKIAVFAISTPTPYTPICRVQKEKAEP